MNLLIARRADLRREQLSEYWEEKQWPIVASIPEVKQFTKRYVQQHNIGQAPPGIIAAPYDRIAEPWFDTIEDVYKVVGTDASREIMQKDDLEFLDPSGTVFMFSEEKINFEA